MLRSHMNGVKTSRTRSLVGVRQQPTTHMALLLRGCASFRHRGKHPRGHLKLFCCPRQLKYVPPCTSSYLDMGLGTVSPRSLHNTSEYGVTHRSRMAMNVQTSESDRRQHRGHSILYCCVDVQISDSAEDIAGKPGAVVSSGPFEACMST